MAVNYQIEDAGRLMKPKNPLNYGGGPLTDYLTNILKVGLITNHDQSIGADI
jgi:hypothetical protein